MTAKIEVEDSLCTAVPSTQEKIGKSAPLPVIFFPEGRERLYIG